MRPSPSILSLAALLLGSLALSSCGGSENGTSTPTSTLGVEANARKVGGMADSTAGGAMGTPASSAESASTEGTDAGNSMNGGGSGSTGTSNTGATMGNSPAGAPTTGATGASKGPGAN